MFRTFAIVTDEVTKHRHLNARISRRMLVPYTEHLGTFLSSMTEEIWKPVLGYEGLYEVSNLGRVKSLFRIVRSGEHYLTVREKILPATITRTGSVIYYRVQLSKGGKKKPRLVANLVCEAFHGPRPVGMECCHKNEISTDNRACNLEWGTRMQNENMPLRRKRIKDKWDSGNFNHLKKPVLQISRDGITIAVYESIRAAMRATGVKDVHICACCKGRAKTAGGYIWKHKNTNF